MSSFSKASGKDEKHDNVLSVSTSEIDTGAELVAGTSLIVDEAEALKIRYEQLSVLVRVEVTAFSLTQAQD